ncbi:lysine--tRNA ligase [Patescibacteria group bacterium]
MSSTLAKIRKQRLEKVEKLRKLGINPYPARSVKTITNKKLFENFSKNEGKKVTITGRIVSLREHGSLKFLNIQDYSGRLQVIIRKDGKLKFDKKLQSLSWKELKLIDVGDFIQVSGKVMKSKTDEISVDAEELKVIVKAIRPLPTKWEGIKDPDVRYRRRYLDFTITPENRELFDRKAMFWDVSREFMKERGFIEVETPIMEHVTGGADAAPFITHHNSLDQDFYLRISTELYQKRLIGGGFEKIYTLGPNFRNEGIDDEHLQEYYQLEWYWAYSDIRDTIQLTKDLYKEIAEKVYGKTKFTYKGHTFDLASKWEDIDYVKAIKSKFGVDVFKTPLKKVYEIIKKNKIDIEFENNRNRMVDNLWKIIRKEVSGPAALLNVPKFISPLAKSHPDDPYVTERFQPIIAGSEVGNAYSELNDPIEQYDRFKEQQDLRNQGDDEAQMMDIDYVEMLEYGMPPASSLGFSERLFWILENVTAREGTLFPQNKFMLEETTKEIYDMKEPKKASLQFTNKFEKKLKQLRNGIVAKDMKEIDDTKVLSIDKNVSESYENINIGFAIIKGVNVERENKDLENFKKKVVNGIEKELSAEEIDDIPQIESYYEMYKKMGVYTHSRKSSPEALLRRIVEGERLYKVNTCVDAYNLAVILTQVSAGAFDLKKIKMPIVIREAKEGEKIKIIGGESKKLKKGEVCYFDKEGAFNIDFNWRDSERTKVTEKTKEIMINVDGVGKITKEQVADALKLTVDLIKKYCGGKVEMMGVVTASKAANSESDKRKKSRFDELKEIKAGITREKAMKLVEENTKNGNLVKHMLASEAAMKEYAKHYVKEGKLHKNNVETWATAGLLHDVMFEKDAEGHMYSGADLLKKKGVSDYVTNAIRVHGNDDGTDHDTLLDKVLIVTESCTGLVVAAVLVLPSKKLEDLSLKSLMKKFKDKRFAAKLDRDTIKEECSRIGRSVEEHLELVLAAMKGISDQLGL